MERPENKSFEMEMCECGHEAPNGYICYDKEGCGTCMPCVIEHLQGVIKKKNKSTKRKSDLRGPNPPKHHSMD